ncbi:cupin domain-containing protein [Natronolimnobius baerhuensis]|uniref:Cupin n=1 Tax=Natronolimnobius baerhuensis TaxID=253108 RepID=A0A202EDS8_9EURY|nr:cupin domain-containing protein [Natronolimnobius baerhuensis]OVE86402.1 cupin [Natronolimnobius baerhuensis]
MGYHVIDPADLEPEPDRPSEMRYISEAAGMERMGLRLYRVEPGEEIPLSGLHYHDEQEEVFYVLEGTLSVETPTKTYHVERGQFFVAEPEHPHRAHNAPDADGDARVLGMGAPPQSDGHSVES